MQYLQGLNKRVTGQDETRQKRHLYTIGIMTFPGFYDKVGAVKKTGHGCPERKNDDYSYVFGTF